MAEEEFIHFRVSRQRVEPDDTLNIRKEGDGDSQIVGQLPPGTRFRSTPNIAAVRRSWRFGVALREDGAVLLGKDGKPVQGWAKAAFLDKADAPPEPQGRLDLGVAPSTAEPVTKQADGKAPPDPYKLLNPDADKDDKDKAAAAPPAERPGQQAAISPGAAKIPSPAPPPSGQKCRVWAASYGGTKALIIKSVVDKMVNYTVLDVNEGAERREADAFISAYAKDGTVAGKFDNQSQALDKAFELCPEG